ncbi:hypothetical protein Krac_1242 [Ktedonobacter racemifer DSM 44963]|uniref:Uncharacterized protein n=1 Tax=Ktedonobacter racemifer DSM 44963 TaxID=485913 RepID=D6U6L6_KTERA|nr:hypothetical protein Krac_1242 [Ktedonobacter racemifer DSM 44963]
MGTSGNTVGLGVLQGGSPLRRLKVEAYEGRVCLSDGYRGNHSAEKTKRSMRPRGRHRPEPAVTEGIFPQRRLKVLEGRATLRRRDEVTEGITPLRRLKVDEVDSLLSLT